MAESESLDQVREWLTTMISLQKTHNEMVHPRWDEQKYPFNRAIWVECAELLDHYGWKWWKEQEPDLTQAKLEIVDIWHFGLSELIVLYGDRTVNAIAERVHGSLKSATPDIPFREAVENVANKALNGSFDIQPFVLMMHALGMSFRELFKIYVDKNTLNLFRQAHGYKEGTYIKNWFGREDNEHLAELAQDLSPDNPSYMTDLEALLTERYHHVCAKAD